jgi:hypothetical protein
VDYKKALDKLRQEVFTESPVTQQVRQSSLIPMRTKQSAPTEDILATSKEWLRSIRASSEQLSKKKERPTGGFAQGLADSISKPVTEQREGNQPPEQPRQEGPSFERQGRSPSPEAQSFLSIMDKHEGGGDYDTLFGHSQREGRTFNGVRVSEMTIGQIKQFSNPSGEYGQWVKGELGRMGLRARVATPMGRYQFVGSTLSNVAKSMGLSDDTVFTPEVQDQMFEYYLRQNINEADTIEGKVAAVRGAWEGFKNVPTETLANLIQQYERS